MWQRIKALKVLMPKKIAWRKVSMGCVVVGAVALAFCVGRFWPSRATAQQPAHPGLIPSPPIIPAHRVEDPGRPVAYINKNTVITRQDLGEYLIARMGPERLDFLINRKILEAECQARGVDVSEAEIEAELIDELKNMNIVNVQHFVDGVLKKFGKSLYEYKEDVLRPKVAMRKLCAASVKVTEDDIKNAFEARYGPKVECRIIVFTKDFKTHDIDKIIRECKKGETEFLQHARNQPVESLATTGGKVPPIHKHFPDKRIEAEAFSLKEGEISALLEMPDGTSVILKCDKHIPRDSTRRLEDETAKLRHEVYARKLAEATPEAFKRLREAANPRTVYQREQPNEVAIRRINEILVKAAQDRAKDAPLPPPFPKEEAKAQSK
jgi:hypothetical protein